MAMGTRKRREKQEDIWIAHRELPSAPGHPFYQRLNELLEGEKFDEFVEGRCAKFYAAKYGRPSLTPGIYFRSLLQDRRPRNLYGDPTRIAIRTQGRGQFFKTALCRTQLKMFHR